MIRWLRNLAWRLTPDDALSRYSFGTKPAQGTYSYEKAIAGKRRAEKREDEKRKAEAHVVKPRRAKVKHIREVKSA